MQLRTFGEEVRDVLDEGDALLLFDLRDQPVVQDAQPAVVGDQKVALYSFSISIGRANEPVVASSCPSRSHVVSTSAHLAPPSRLTA